MSRRKSAQKRDIAPDPKFHEKDVSKFVNRMMLDGKKSLAEKRFYQAMEIIKNKVKEDPIKVFKEAIENVKPKVEVKTKRVGGANYQVPLEVTPGRQQTLAYRWIINFARKRNERTIEEKMANELIDAYNNEGASIKKREEVWRMAEANKAFAHFRM
ncbi:MAG: 30S ribosomal protein S7 [Candidatus Cloacimonetes bacterium]|nr:30S ribosomal protein S7 [Candidatus Cloacimonadota bacterium]MBS3766911.1 30S ribosomal protein S7 [Candidatus Cloacimonadota bacterium]